MRTHPVQKNLRRAQTYPNLQVRKRRRKVVDEEWWRRTSISSPPRSFCDILFVGGHEALPPVRCAPPSPLVRPCSGISRRLCLFAGHLNALWRPLPLHPRASGRARAEQKAAAHPVPHAPPARALRRPRRRRRGRLERRRLRPLHGGRLTVGRRGAVTCVGQLQPGVRLGALRVRHGRRATGRRAAGRRRRRWRPRRGRREPRRRSRAGRAWARGRRAARWRAAGFVAARGRRRAARARPGRAHRAGRAALGWAAARAVYMCTCVGSARVCWCVRWVCQAAVGP